MWSKALWYKNYKQAKSLCWAFMIVSLLVPFQVFSKEQSLARQAGTNYLQDAIYSDFFIVSSFFQVIIIFILALTLVGAERTNEQYAYSLSLPVRRQDIFLTKWLLGVFLILGGVTLSVLLAILQFSRAIYLKTYIPTSLFIELGGYVCLVLLAIYTFVLMFGYLTGNFIAQATLSGICLVLTLGLYFLLGSFMDVFLNTRLGESMEIILLFSSLPLGLGTLSFYHQAGATGGQNIELLYFVPAFVYLLASFGVTLWLSKDSKVEEHGRLLLYKPLQPVLRIGVFVCFFLLGGAIVSESTLGIIQHRAVVYLIGGAIFGGVSSLILNRLLSIKTMSTKKG